MSKARVFFVVTAAFFYMMVFTVCADARAQRTVRAQPAAPMIEIHEFERRVFELTNLERTRRGLAPFIWNETLASAARGHCEDLLRNNMTGHTGSNGSTVKQRVERSGITNAMGWSENIAYGQSTPEAMVRAWMNSPGHRANILHANRTHIGVGLIRRPVGSRADWPIYGTQKFICLHDGSAASLPDNIIIVDSYGNNILTAAPVNAAPAVSVNAPAAVKPAGEPVRNVRETQTPSDAPTDMFTAIPNPAVRSSSAGAISFFWQGKRVIDAVFPVYDASDELVAGLEINDRGARSSDAARRRVGTWNLRDLYGRPLPAGRYTVRGVLTTSDGDKERVGLTVEIR